MHTYKYNSGVDRHVSCGGFKSGKIEINIEKIMLFNSSALYIKKKCLLKFNNNEVFIFKKMFPYPPVHVYTTEKYVLIYIYLFKPKFWSYVTDYKIPQYS